VSREETSLRDPYAFHDADVEEPPPTFGRTLRRIGPGMILAASIVGSGELIATTALGAKVGYVMLWLILVSCFIKPAIQSEMGRYAIATGETGLAGFNRVPGPRAKVGWVVWGWALMTLCSLFSVSGMFAGVAEALHTTIPLVPKDLWVGLLLALSLWLLLGGGYSRVEHLATVKVGLFTLITLLGAAILVSRPGALTVDQVKQGLSLGLPPEGLVKAIAVFGITGVGASELFMYPYWCIEKGYARFAGARDDSPAWTNRALGWIRVMNTDISASMVIYTVATVSFYLLGAGVLHPAGKTPESAQMIGTLSEMYTATLGGWSLPVFYVGACVTLYGTIFAATAANSRVFSDMACLMGAFPKEDYAARVRWRQRFVWGLLLIPASVYFLRINPVQMVTIGGTGQAIMLPIIAGSVLWLKRRHLPPGVGGGTPYRTGLWIASLATMALMAWYVIKLLVPGS